MRGVSAGSLKDSHATSDANPAISSPNDEASGAWRDARADTPQNATATNVIISGAFDRGTWPTMVHRHTNMAAPAAVRIQATATTGTRRLNSCITSRSDASESVMMKNSLTGCHFT